ncbi:hypothetical protein GAY30_33875, partial [Azospirillum brasilense]|nr:hypothetical protein [Azospirillum brasilense]
MDAAEATQTRPERRGGAPPRGRAPPPPDTLAAKRGLSTVLLDEQAAPGGQIYRAITRSPVKNPSVLGTDY